jgi:hypothetical protein
MDIDEDVKKEFEAVQADRKKAFNELSVWIDAGDKGTDGVIASIAPDALLAWFRSLVAREKELLMQAGLPQEIIATNYQEVDEFISELFTPRRGGAKVN